MGRPLVDTDVLYIELLAPQDRRYEINRRFLDTVGSYAITIFNLLELCAKAAFRSPGSEVRELFDAYHERADVVVLYPRADVLWSGDFFDRFVERTLQRILTARDFQDALIANIAEEHGVEAIITWNTRHFAGKVPMPVLTPEEWLNMHKESES